MAQAELTPPDTHPRPPGGGENFAEATTPGQLTLVSVTASGILVVGFACALMAHWIGFFPPRVSMSQQASVGGRAKARSHGYLSMEYAP